MKIRHYDRHGLQKRQYLSEHSTAIISPYYKLFSTKSILHENLYASVSCHCQFHLIYFELFFGYYWGICGCVMTRLMEYAKYPKDY